MTKRKKFLVAKKFFHVFIVLERNQSSKKNYKTQNGSNICRKFVKIRTAKVQVFTGIFIIYLIDWDKILVIVPVRLSLPAAPVRLLGALGAVSLLPRPEAVAVKEARPEAIPEASMFRTPEMAEAEISTLPSVAPLSSVKNAR